MFPILGDQHRFLVVLTLSREVLDMGMGLVGRDWVEGLDRVWWKLRRLRDKSHVGADTIEGDSDSDEIVEIGGGGSGDLAGDLTPPPPRPPPPPRRCWIPQPSPYP